MCAQCFVSIHPVNGSSDLIHQGRTAPKPKWSAPACTRGCLITSPALVSANCLDTPEEVRRNVELCGTARSAACPVPVHLLLHRGAFERGGVRDDAISV